jgi:hypothetical protein
LCAEDRGYQRGLAERDAEVASKLERLEQSLVDKAKHDATTPWVHLERAAGVRLAMTALAATGAKPSAKTLETKPTGTDRSSGRYASNDGLVDRATSRPAEAPKEPGTCLCDLSCIHMTVKGCLCGCPLHGIAPGTSPRAEPVEAELEMLRAKLKREPFSVIDELQIYIQAQRALASAETVRAVADFVEDLHIDINRGEVVDAIRAWKKGGR